MMERDEIAQRIDPIPDTQPVDSPASSHVVSKVLDDDNLLDDILLRVGFPTTLVHAAMVCRRWLRHISDPKFLSRFRKLHPPRLLGFYFSNGTERKAPFVPVPTPQPPELTAVIRCASFSLDTYGYRSAGARVVDCWGGNVFMRLHYYDGVTGYTFAVHMPLCARRGLTILPPLPSHQRQDSNILFVCELLFREEGSGLSYLRTDSTKERTTVHIYLLQDGVWCMHSSAATEGHGLPLTEKLLLIDNKVYMCMANYILVFDLTTLSFSRIQYPQGVGFPKIIMLSQADDDFGVYLICANELQLTIWLYKGDNWMLVDTICLREMYDDSRMSYYRLAGGHKISQVGANAEFVLLEMGHLVLYLDVKCRTLHKVYEMTIADKAFGHYIHPFMMIWPPTFPSINHDPARFGFVLWMIQIYFIFVWT